MRKTCETIEKGGRVTSILRGLPGMDIGEGAGIVGGIRVLGWEKVQENGSQIRRARLG
jgi:hypothetical protein